MKKIYNIIITLLISFITFSVYASTNTCNREELENYGVNKFKITSENLNYVKNTPCVDASEKVYDFSDILTDEEEREIYNRIMEFIDKTSMDLVILTSNYPYTYDSANEYYAVDFYDFNDFGIDFDKNSGLIFFRNTYESNPYYAIYTFGEAQRYFSEERLENYLLDAMYSYIHSGEYLNGINFMIDRLENYYDSGIDSSYKNYYVDENGYLQKEKEVFKPMVVSAIISSIITWIVIGGMIKKNRMVKLATDAIQYVDKQNIRYSVNEDKFVNSVTTRVYDPPSSSSSSGGGGGGGSHHSSSGHSGGGHSGGGRHG